jgi:FixJ family two-component response regulator
MPPKKDPTHLGPRELQLVELIRQGLTNKEIAYEVNYRRVNATASQETHETTTSTLAPEGRVPALERIT